MAILAFQKPDKLIMLEGVDKRTARFELSPLEPGYGITIGNALRRILLSSIEGYALASIRIEGVDHEFATIPGVLEDVTNIILNLKQVRLAPTAENVVTESVSLSVSGRDVFKAGDLTDKLTSFEVINPELEICHLGKNAAFNIDLVINKGRGYHPAEDNKTPEDAINTIPIDSIYTPIRKVMFRTENFRVEQKTDYEKLILEVETDGTINPKDAMQQAAAILIEHFRLFAGDDCLVVRQMETESATGDMDPETIRVRQLLKSDIKDCDFTVRARNCLIGSNVHTLADLVSHEQSELLKFRNFGKKTLEELTEYLDSIGLEFGMDLDKYNLDND